jgi:hypothetical protein
VLARLDDLEARTAQLRASLRSPQQQQQQEAQGG